MAQAKQITRKVSPTDLGDLLVAPAHATVAFVRDGRVHAAPVRLQFENDRYFVGLDEGQLAPVPGDRASLLIDDGCYHAELRGVRIDGNVAPAECRDGGTLTWLEIIPTKTIAWDYGEMRRR